MRARKFHRGEPIRKGNPNGLTFNQHVFPTESIKRFLGTDDRVSVHLIGQQKEVRLKPNDAIFCARRGWDEASEHGYMKNVEDEFQNLAGQILSAKRPPHSSESQIVTRFHELWRRRQEARELPDADLEISGSFKGNHLTKEQEENLEKNGYRFSRGNFVPGRQIAGLRIMFSLNQALLPDVQWGLVFSRHIEFLVPDSFQNVGVVPLTPNYCLIASATSGEISSENAVQINRDALALARNYYFGRDLSKCGT